MTARNRVVREPYATWCGRTPVEIIHGLLPDCSIQVLFLEPALERVEGRIELLKSLLLGHDLVGQIVLHADDGVQVRGQVAGLALACGCEHRTVKQRSDKILALPATHLQVDRKVLDVLGPLELRLQNFGGRHRQS